MRVYPKSTPLHGVRQIDIIKGVFVLSTPVIYRSGTKIIRTNKLQNVAKKLCFVWRIIAKTLSLQCLNK